MKSLNFLSFIGALSAFNSFYNVFILHHRGPSHYPMLVLTFVLLTFIVSYLLSLMNTKSAMMALFSLLLVFVSLTITGIFSFLVFTHKAFYPNIFGISMAYVQFAILILLAFKWNKVR